MKQETAPEAANAARYNTRISSPMRGTTPDYCNYTREDLILQLGQLQRWGYISDSVFEADGSIEIKMRHPETGVVLTGQYKAKGYFTIH